jgi:hypothetical protein
MRDRASSAMKVGVRRQADLLRQFSVRTSYAAINMDSPQKRWFCSEDDASAGWRPRVGPLPVMRWPWYMCAKSFILWSSRSAWGRSYGEPY